MTDNYDKFVHFRAQSSYSMLESTIKIDELVSLAAQNKMSAICLSDRNNLFASLEFAIACKKKHIQAIHGAILNIEFINQANNKQEFAEILLIAKDPDGYQNLLKLVSYSFIKNNRNICNHITIADLQKHQAGIIVLSAFTKGIIGKLLILGYNAEAKLQAKKLQAIFGDRFYFEIMRHNLADEKQIEANYLQLAKELSIPLLATNQVLFRDINMHDAHDVLLCISESVVREQQNRRRVSNQCYFKTANEMIKLFHDLPEAIENSVNLVKRIHVMAEVKNPELPNFTDGSISEEELIRQDASQGLMQRLSIKFAAEKVPKSQQEIIKKEYFKRLEYELNIICKMNFSGYFLIVSDFIKWSKKNGIAVGPGRGSGAGSIIAWSLLITDLDPIKFGLLFERFLNPERVSMPDFDIDFCQERREEVINYVREKYGDNRVCQIITFGKMQAKAVIKDVARVLELPYSVADYLTELVPFNAVNPVTLTQAISEVSELGRAALGKGLYDIDGDNELIKQVLDTALILEGLQRHSSTHAAGIVIANKDMMEIAPVCKDSNSDMLIVQYSMKYCELSGLIKFDFLGLQTLTIITKCLEILNEQGINIEMDKLLFDDKKTFKMLSEGMGNGVFQFESVGMKNALRKLKPDNIDDIIALGALYRPGPMDNIPIFIACKHGKQEADYLHPSLKTILEPTYGVIVYQEQVMEIARKLSGYSLGAADLLRKAMGKKVKAEMDAQEEIFVGGAIKNGISEAQAKSIFETVAKFAGYGFNKAHASAYGVISYQTAYLKANFPAEFFVAAMNLDLDSSDKINSFLQEARSFGIKIKAPSINYSDGFFKIKHYDVSKSSKKAIIFAIGAIKNVTVNFGKAMAKNRQENGEFKNIIDFLERLEPKLINRKLLENLIKAGCFDQLHENRNSLLQSISRLMAYSTSYHKEKESSQISLISVSQISPEVLINTEKLNETKLALHEFDVMGLFIDNHPLSAHINTFKKQGVKFSSDIKNLSKGSHLIKIAGVINKKDTRMSKRGRFVTLLLSDNFGIIEVTIYDETIMQDYANLLKVKMLVIVEAEVFIDEGGARITAKKFTSLKDVLHGIKYDLVLFPKNKSDIKKIVQLISDSKKNQEKSENTSITIFLPTKQNFLAKIIIADKFGLTSNCINELQNFMYRCL